MAWLLLRGATTNSIREWRRLLLMTQAEVAAAAGVSEARYAQWERGEKSPRLARLRRLARVLRVSPAALLAEFPNETEGKAVTTAPARYPVAAVGLPGVLQHATAAALYGDTYD
jgi:transcriptional regulator with XRE-family HTH domain